MSLVLDALNKANQEKKQQKDDINEANHLKELKKIQKKRFYVLISVNIILIIGFICYFLFFNQKSVKSLEKKNQINDNVITNKVANKPKLEQTQAIKNIRSDFAEDKNQDVKIKRKYFKAEDGFILRLNGTYIDKNEAFVLFEDDMYQAGDIINNKVKVLSVTKKTVKIQYKGNNYEIPN